MDLRTAAGLGCVEVRTYKVTYERKHLSTRYIVQRRALLHSADGSVCIAYATAVEETAWY